MCSDSLNSQWGNKMIFYIKCLTGCTDSAGVDSESGGDLSWTHTQLGHGGWHGQHGFSLVSLS